MPGTSFAASDIGWLAKRAPSYRDVVTRPAPIPAPWGVRRRTRRPLVLVEAATLLSGTGNGVALVALPWLVLERTGSPVAAGVLAAATAIPLLGSSLFSGTVVDIVGRRRTAVVSDALSGLSVAAIPVVDATVGLTMPALVALAVLGAVFDPAGVTARETLVPAASHAAGWRLERANSVHEAVWGMAFLVGPGVGGVLIATVGAVGTLWVTAGGFALSLVMVVLVRLPGADTPLPHDRPAGIWRGTLEGLAFVWRDRLLRSIALVTVAVVAVYLPIEAVVLPTYFVDAGAPARLGAVVMAMSAGGVVGAIAYGACGHLVSRRTAFVVALVGACLAVLGMAVLPPFPALLGFAAATGLLYGPIDPLANYAMQTRTPERLRGRVVGVMTSAEYAAGPAGYLLAGPVVEGLGPETAFLVLAVLLLAVGVAAVPLRALALLDDEPLYPPSPEAGTLPPGRGPLPLGEQSVPPPFFP